MTTERRRGGIREKAWSGFNEETNIHTLLHGWLRYFVNLSVAWILATHLHNANTRSRVRLFFGNQGTVLIPKTSRVTVARNSHAFHEKLRNPFETVT